MSKFTEQGDALEGSGVKTGFTGLSKDEWSSTVKRLEGNTTVTNGVIG